MDLARNIMPIQTECDYNSVISMIIKLKKRCFSETLWHTHVTSKLHNLLYMTKLVIKMSKLSFNENYRVRAGA